MRGWWQHRAIGGRLLALLEGGLPQSEARRLRRHVESCPACRRELESLESARQVVRSARDCFPAAEPESGLWESLERRLPQAASAPMRSRPRALALGGAAAACALLLGVGVLELSRPGGPGTVDERVRVAMAPELGPSDPPSALSRAGSEAAPGAAGQLSAPDTSASSPGTPTQHPELTASDGRPHAGSERGDGRPGASAAAGASAATGSPAAPRAPSPGRAEARALPKAPRHTHRSDRTLLGALPREQATGPRQGAGPQGTPVPPPRDRAASLDRSLSAMVTTRNTLEPGRESVPAAQPPAGPEARSYAMAGRGRVDSYAEPEKVKEGGPRLESSEGTPAMGAPGGASAALRAPAPSAGTAGTADASAPETLAGRPHPPVKPAAGLEEKSSDSERPRRSEPLGRAEPQSDPQSALKRAPEGFGGVRQQRRDEAADSAAAPRQSPNSDFQKKVDGRDVKLEPAAPPGLSSGPKAKAGPGQTREALGLGAGQDRQRRGASRRTADDAERYERQARRQSSAALWVRAGRLWLDAGATERAVAAFKSALALDREYLPAKQGLEAAERRLARGQQRRGRG